MKNTTITNSPPSRPDEAKKKKLFLKTSAGLSELYLSNFSWYVGSFSFSFPWANNYRNIFISLEFKKRKYLREGEERRGERNVVREKPYLCEEKKTEGVMEMEMDTIKASEKKEKD